MIRTPGLYGRFLQARTVFSKHFAAQTEGAIISFDASNEPVVVA